MITRRKVLVGAASVLAGTTALGGYAFGIEPRWRLALTRHHVRPPNWPQALTLKIAVITDVHAGEPYMPAARIRHIVDVTNAQNPDVIVLLGDYVAGHKWQTRHVPPAEWSREYARLEAPLGVHAVLGNHDWWDDHIAQRAGHGPVISRRALEDVGIPVYENDVVRLGRGDQSFWLAGLGDQIAFVRGRKGTPGRFQGIHDLAGTLAKVTDAAPVVLLAHEPDIFPKVPDRVALTLSGHTHGGQVRLAGYSPIVPSRYGNRYAYGHIIEDDRNLVVSGGLGCSIWPVRFGMPPEIVIATVSA